MSKRIWIAVLMLAAVALPLMKAVAQGGLVPSGAPTPSMKTFDQIEPRTPISETPYIITEPGSYYLTGNLTNSYLGIRVVTNNVTLDLMGFTLTGDSSGAGIDLNGSTNGVIKNVTVRNGMVRNFSVGLAVRYAQDSRFENLLVVNNTSVGVSVEADYGLCKGNAFQNCIFSENGSSGFAVLSRFSGQFFGNTIANCTISKNGQQGIRLYVFDSGQCNGNTIVDCSICDNGFEGITLNGSGECDGNMIRDCSVAGNARVGLFLCGEGNTVMDCIFRGNTDKGISLSSAYGNRLEGNLITGTTGSSTFGIHCGTTSGNLIFHNTCIGQDDNFLLGANDTYGPEVSSSGALSGTNPWANFSR